MSYNGGTWLEAKKLQPLGNAPGLAVFHLPLRSRSARLCPALSAPSGSSLGTACTVSLGFCQWEAPTGPRRA